MTMDEEREVTIFGIFVKILFVCAYTLLLLYGNITQGAAFLMACLHGIFSVMLINDISYIIGKKIKK